MPPTDISEKGLETLILRHMTGTDGLAPVAEGLVAETPDALAAAKAAGSGWLAGNPKDYDRTYALDVPQLLRFLEATQPETLKKLRLSNWSDKSDIARLKFLARLSNEIGKRGVIDVLRKGVDHGPLHFDLFYGTPSPRNAKAAALYAQNRFSVTRQLRYSQDETRRALDLCLFINGLPFSTFELKNSLTKQTVEDAVEQYRRDRDPREKLFEFGRCVVHFAVDDAEVRMCTELRGNLRWQLSCLPVTAEDMEENQLVGKRLLLVEDDRAVREMLKTALSENAYTVVEANNGAEAFGLPLRFMPFWKDCALGPFRRFLNCATPASPSTP